MIRSTSTLGGAGVGDRVTEVTTPEVEEGEGEEGEGG